MPKKYAILLLLAGSVVVADQLTKFWIVRHLTNYLDPQPTLAAKLKAMYSAAPKAEWEDGLHFHPKRFITAIDEYLRIRYAENPGAAWGLFRNMSENVRGPLFHVVSIGAVILILFYYRKLSGNDPTELWALWGLPLVLGGAIGNYTDRLARGFVIDFIEAHWHDRATWPSFNVADMAICVGVGMLVLDSFLRREKKEDKRSPASAR